MRVVSANVSRDGGVQPFATYTNWWNSSLPVNYYDQSCSYMNLRTGVWYLTYCSSASAKQQYVCFHEGYSSPQARTNNLPTLSPTVPPVVSCPPGYNFNPQLGKCFKYYSSAMTWNAARDTCNNDYHSTLLALRDKSTADLSTIATSMLSPRGCGSVCTSTKTSTTGHGKLCEAGTIKR